MKSNTSKSNKPMTNYNERLDEIVRDAYRGEISWIHDQLDGTSFIGESLEGVEKNIIDTKQAITSLIKELVKEAKPEKKSTEDYGSWEEGHRNAGWNNCLEHFEQNLLKALSKE